MRIHGGWPALTLVALASCRVTSGGAAASAPQPVAAVATSPQTSTPAPLAVAAIVDQELRARWKAEQIDVAPDVGDDGFLRRATLDLLGRIPTPEEREAFLATPADGRRARLVAALVRSPEHADYWSWKLHATLFIPQTEAAPRQTAPAYLWFREQLAANRPWNEFVFDLLTAAGELEYHAATSYVVAHLQRAGVEGLTTSVSENLLGVQLACAQCHDHPYAEWTPRDFWALAAGFRTAAVTVIPQERFTRLVLGDDENRRLHTLDGLATPPQDLAPALLGHSIERRDGESLREATARAVTQSDRLAQAAVSRVWTTLVGHGLAHPWNDLSTAGEEGALLERLADDFRRTGYDEHRLIEVVAASAPYHRSARGPEQTTAAAVENFARATVRPLDAYQLHRSLLAATGLQDLSDHTFTMLVTQRPDVVKRAHEDLFGDGCPRDADEQPVALMQNLMLLNDGVTHYGSLARHGSALARILERHATEDERVEAIYLRALARPPTEAERRRARELVGATEAPQGYEDLLFALLNSAEFLTNH